MKERLIELMSYKGLSASRLAELIDVQPSSISHILSGRNNLSLDFAVRILTVFPDISPDWLLLGTDNITRGIDDATCVERDYEHVSQQSSFDFSGNGGSGCESAIDKSQRVNNITTNKEAETVIIFYADNTFKEYTRRNASEIENT